VNRVLIVNGPNLDLLGSREPEVYGDVTLPELEESIRGFGESLGLQISTLQSNHEGEIIEALRDSDADGIVINPGALTHTSRALADAIAAKQSPTVEVHISNILEREPWRAHSLIEQACVKSIYGRGIAGYRAAIRHLVNQARSPGEVVRYGPHDDNVGDLRRGNRGLVVLLHGGVWRHQFERDTTESLAVDLHSRGFSTWNLEYRRIGKGGGWPACGHDVLTALDFSPQLGIAGPVIVLGHSVGSYLGLWAAARSRVPVDLFVGLASVVDLELGVSDRGELEHESRAFLEAGAPPRVGSAGPALLVHPINDPVVSFAHSGGLASSEGHPLLESEGGHYDLLDPSKSHWEWVLEKLPR
jgi:3-dehydroquinate dehydratase II